eukprot:TRINITY_DN575_c0_g1_i2.p1 TRINITY_DN575_c0_g1~~TRINITY_DN575_c0_g1_i2.p1  ORF type:complete len:563 (+),score=174.10 TRINITY_DN575_c0_g1_i2:1497-3185(+)
MKMGRDDSADIWMHKGICLSHMKAHRKAVASFDRALELSTEANPEIHYQKAYSLQELKDTKNALIEYDRCLELDPQNKFAYNQKGVLLYGTVKDFYGALACFDAAIACDPQYLVASTNRAVVLQAMAMSSTGPNNSNSQLSPQSGANMQSSLLVPSTESNSTTISFNSKQPSTNGSKTKFVNQNAIASTSANANFGSTDASNSSESLDNAAQTIKKISSLIKKKSYEAAVALCESAQDVLEDDVQRATVWNKMGYALSKLHRCQDAIDCYNTSIKLHPDNPDVWNNLGFALQILKRYTEAVAAFEHAVSLDNSNKVVWNSLGQVLRAMKQYEDAIDCFNNALDIDPDFFFAKRNKRQTEKLFHKQSARQKQNTSGDDDIVDNDDTTFQANISTPQMQDGPQQPSFSMLNSPEQVYPLLQSQTIGAQSVQQNNQMQQQPYLFGQQPSMGFEDLSNANNINFSSIMNYGYGDMSMNNTVNNTNTSTMGMNTPPGWGTTTPNQSQMNQQSFSTSTFGNTSGGMWQGLNLSSANSTNPESVPGLMDSGLWGDLNNGDNDSDSFATG